MPPVLVQVAQRVRSFVGKKEPKDTGNDGLAEWEYVSQDWPSKTADAKIKGWNVNSVLDVYKAKWPAFIRQLEGSLPLCLSHESDLSNPIDPIFHNITMSYGYALGLASRLKTCISLLDWGGGIGHYYPISRALIPDLTIDYYCKDVPILVEYGRQLFPQAHFYTDDSCLQQRYDFVLASTSLHYSENWRSTMRGLMGATGAYLFITQLPIIHHLPSFVMVQRPYAYGYETEYLGWCINRQQFLECAKASGVELVREFIVGYQPHIRHAPEQCEYRGFLFRSITESGHVEPTKE